MSYLTQLYTNSLSNQNISSALLLGTFTNTTRLRKIIIDVFADQVAGNGNYVVYATRQRSGAGSAYEVGGRTTVAVPSGVTSQAFPTIALTCGATDVIKVYLIGLAGDTTTPDTIMEVSEEFVLTDSSGNVTVGTNTDKTGYTVSTVSDKTGYSLSVTPPTAAQIDTQLSGTHGSGAWGGAGGSGSSTWTETVRDANNNTLDGVQVWVTSDLAGATIVASGITNGVGKVTFQLDPATYYLWCARAGINFSNPATITVT